LDDYPPTYAVEAELTARDGDRTRAADLFRRAAAMASSEPERRALRARIDELMMDEPTEETDD
jgi:RNA polymerase sigma-70 factor (ECF subfamily)